MHMSTMIDHHLNYIRLRSILQCIFRLISLHRLSFLNNNNIIFLHTGVLYMKELGKLIIKNERQNHIR